MSLTIPISVHKVQTALHTKAKESPNFRLRCIIEVYRDDVMAFTY